MEIPRHYFLDKAFSDWAYKDVAFPIDADQTISQPYTVAVQTTLLNVKKGDKIKYTVSVLGVQTQEEFTKDRKAAQTALLAADKQKMDDYLAWILCS